MYTLRQKRAIRNIAVKLDGAYQANDLALTRDLQRLITGPDTRSPEISHLMRFGYQQGVIVLAEYSYRAQRGKTTIPVRHAIIAIPQSEGSIPMFDLRKKRLFAEAKIWKKWVDAPLEDYDAFNKQFRLITRPDEAKAMAHFFAEHPKLAELCLAKKSYRLVSNGRWLLFYNPSLRLAPKAEHYSNYLGLAQQLYRLTWPDDGWQLKSVSTEGAPSYEDYIKSLKKDEQ